MMVKASEFFIPFKKNIKSDIAESQGLLLKLGLIGQIGRGLFCFLPLGFRVLKNISNIISKHFTLMGFNEALFPNLQPSKLWEASGRYNAYGKEKMCVHDRNQNILILGPTAEEIFTNAIDFNSYYNRLPVCMFNIQTKFRDEIRPTGGLLRAREFIMCDGYSYHASAADLDTFYANTIDGYKTMFKEFGLSVSCVKQCDTGEIGGEVSHEFFADNKDNFELEVGHIFKLGTQYTQHLSKEVFMGCYGVGVSRMIAVYSQIMRVIDNGIEFIKWPRNIAPFLIYLMGSNSQRSSDICMKIHAHDPVNIYYSDTKKSFGEKMVISKLLSAPLTVIIGDRELESGNIICNGRQVLLDDFMHDIESAGKNISGFVDYMLRCV